MHAMTDIINRFWQRPPNHTPAVEQLLYNGGQRKLMFLPRPVVLDVQPLVMMTIFQSQDYSTSACFILTI